MALCLAGRTRLRKFLTPARPVLVLLSFVATLCAIFAVGLQRTFRLPPAIVPAHVLLATMLLALTS